MAKFIPAIIATAASTLLSGCMSTIALIDPMMPKRVPFASNTVYPPFTAEVKAYASDSPVVELEINPNRTFILERTYYVGMMSHDVMSSDNKTEHPCIETPFFARSENNLKPLPKDTICAGDFRSSRMTPGDKSARLRLMQTFHDIMQKAPKDVTFDRLFCSKPNYSTTVRCTPVKYPYS